MVTTDDSGPGARSSECGGSYVHRQDLCLPEQLIDVRSAQAIQKRISMFKPMFFATGALLSMPLAACSSTPSTGSDSGVPSTGSDSGADSATTATEDGGTKPGPGGGGTNCKELAVCCAKLPDPAKTSCEDYLPRGEDYCGNFIENYCSLDPSACTKLGACCGTLTGDDKSTCDLQVSTYAGNVATCGVALRTWQGKGECR